MKPYARSLAVMLCALLTISIDASARTPTGGDTFDTAPLSSQNWLVPPGQDLVPLGGHLVYLASGADASDSKSVTWNHYDDTQTSSWTYRIDVSMPQFVLTGSQHVIYGLEVDGSNGTHVFSYLTEFVDGGQILREIAAFTTAGVVSVAATSNIATVQVRYDAPNHRIFAEYDPDGPDALGHYSFTVLASQGGLAPADRFDPTNLIVIGQSNGGVPITAATAVYGDNAQAAVVPEPKQVAFLVSAIVFLGIWLGRKSQRRTR